MKTNTTENNEPELATKVKAPPIYAIKNASDHWQLCTVGAIVTDQKSKFFGKPELRPFKYYGSLQQAAIGLQNELLCDATADSEVDTETIIRVIKASTGIIVRAVENAQ